MSNTDMGREPVVLVELDQDFCQETYGVAPCTAGLGVTGDAKCFQGFANCQDTDNYNRGTLTLRFVRPQVDVPKSWKAIPSLMSVSTTPTKLNVGGGDRNAKALGNRASVTIEFQDHPYSDLYVDKYVNERPDGTAGVAYNPIENGTFWTKWLRRNPYYQNRQIRIIEGYMGQSLNEMRTRHYIIQEINGPDDKGRVRIKAKDVLKLADDDRAEAPKGSRGELMADLNDSATSFSVVGADSGEYPLGGGILRIGDEVLTYGSATQTGDQVDFSSVSRGQRNTEADSHDAAETVQLCLEYDNEDPWVVANDLLTTYGNVPSSFIPFSDWGSEGNVWLAQFTVTTLITEPTGVTQLLGELAQQAMFYVWWDEIAQEIKLRALRPPSEEPTVITDDKNIIAGSVKTSVDADQRVSEVWIYYLQISPVESLDEAKNYRRLRIRVDDTASSDNEYGERRIKKIFSRWLETDAQTVTLATRYLARYRDNPRFATIKLDAKDRGVWTGDIADLETRLLVDNLGRVRSSRFQVIEAEEVVPGEQLQCKLQSYEFVGSNFGFWMIENAPVFTNATDEEKRSGGWWSNASGEMSDGSDGYKWQ